jgi:hypothetical protein
MSISPRPVMIMYRIAISGTVNITQVEAACMNTRRNQVMSPKDPLPDSRSTRKAAVEDEEQPGEDEAVHEVDDKSPGGVDGRPGNGCIQGVEFLGEGIGIDQAIHEGKEEAGRDAHHDEPLHGRALAGETTSRSRYCADFHR